MPKRTIKRVKNFADAIAYQKIFWSKFQINVPLSYFINSKSYLMVVDGKIVGGFMIVPRNISRTYRQIPFTQEGIFALDYLSNKRFAELTGYFIDDHKEGFYLVTRWLLHVLFSPYSCFLYSYPESNANLRKYYSFGNPLLLYKGIIRNIDDINGEQRDRIELITKIGFCKLFVRRLFKQKSR